jgi:hypothetical protein
VSGRVVRGALAAACTAALILASLAAASAAGTGPSGVFVAEPAKSDALYPAERSARVGAAIDGADIDAAKALSLIYGNYDPRTGRSSWFLDDAALRRIGEDGCAGALQIDCDLAASVWSIGERRVVEGGKERYILLTAARSGLMDGYLRAPLVGGAIFQKDGGSWRLLSESRVLETMTNLNDVHFVAIGPQRQGVLLSPGESRQGELLVDTTLIVELGDRLVPVLALGQTSYDNKGACSTWDCVGYKSTFAFKPGSNPNYYDVVRTTRGTYRQEKPRPGAKPNSNGYVPTVTTVFKVEESATYRFKDGAYRP